MVTALFLETGRLSEPNPFRRDISKVGLHVETIDWEVTAIGGAGLLRSAGHLL
jgi:hypothetical protein